MLQISNAAMHLLKDVLDADQAQDFLFRLIMDDDFLALARVDTPEDGDLIYEDAGVVVLAAPSALADDMQTQLIDVEQTDEGTRLVLLTQ